LKPLLIGGAQGFAHSIPDGCSGGDREQPRGEQQTLGEGDGEHQGIRTGAGALVERELADVTVLDERDLVRAEITRLEARATDARK
jgi:hypothetical protein